MKNSVAAAMFLAVASLIFCSQCYAKEPNMNDKDHLYTMWTNNNPVTADQ